MLIEEEEPPGRNLEVPTKSVSSPSSSSPSSFPLPVISSYPEEDPNDPELYEIEGYPVDKEPISLDFCEKLLLVGRYRQSGVMAYTIYKSHQKGEYLSAFPEREENRDVDAVAMAVWIDQNSFWICHRRRGLLYSNRNVSTFS